MKKLFYFFIVSITFFSCKKENVTKNSSGNTSNNVSTGIDFSSSVTAVAKLGNGVKDVEGNNYKTTIIGSQEWMAENLKVSKFNDGSAIKNLTTNDDWYKNKDIPAWCYYNNDVSNNVKYGKLYNWYVVNQSMNGLKNVCPIGWHVPSISEWDELISFLGGDNVAAGKMKEVGEKNWNNPNVDATNSSLFTALPAGVRLDYDGRFNGLGYDSNWWSSTEADNTYSSVAEALTRDVDHDDASSEETSEGFISGVSIRCLKD